MGYRPMCENNVNNLTDDQKRIYDMFYDGDTCKIEGLDIADYHSDNSGTNTPGIRINGDIVQVDFTYQNGRSITVTFNPNDPSSLGKSLTVVPGAGGLSEFGVADGYKTGQLNNYYLDGNADYTSITFGGPYSDENYATSSIADKAVPQIEEIINGGNNPRHVVAGASQGSINTVDLAGEIFASYGDSEKQPVDIMLLDAKSDQANGKGGCQPFVDYLNDHPTVKQDLIDTGSVVYAYEGNNAITGSPDKALAALKELSSDGVHTLMIVNPELNAHGGVNSPEENISNGEVDKIFNGFDIDPSIKELAAGKQENLYYIIDPNEEDGLKKDAEGNIIAVTDDQVSKYLESSREEVRKNFNDLSTLEHITLQETPFKDVASTTENNNSRTSINYDSVVNNTNFVVDSINKTSFINNDFDYQYCDSTTTFPESLNEANAYLFNTSGALLNGIANDTKNIEQILLNYAYIDAHLADEAAYLNPENNYGYYSREDVNVDKTATNEEQTRITSIFGENIAQGDAGKISLTDLENMVNGSQLTGPIGEGLANEMEDARDLKEKLENLLNSTDIEDPTWNIMKDRLMEYQLCCDLRIAAAEILNDAYVESLNYVMDYMAPYKNLDDSEIPKYTDRIDKAIAKIAQLEATNTALGLVEATPIYGNDEEGNEIICGYDYSPVYEAQRQIAANNEDIAVLQQQLIADQKYLDKLNGLAQTLNDANKIIDNALLEVENLYTNEVSTIDSVFVTPIDSSAAVS